jgi:hypothetical protein
MKSRFRARATRALAIAAAILGTGCNSIVGIHELSLDDDAGAALTAGNGGSMTGPDAAGDEASASATTGLEPDAPCTANSECQSRVCHGGLCQAPNCKDGVRNGTEVDIDCGGSCPICADGAACAIAANCASGVCTASVCKAASCTDSVANGNETDVDCGGPSCPRCDNKKQCEAGADCQSGICEATQLVCQDATCQDSTQNPGETDVDCGGGSCAPCAASKKCLVASDCTSGVCEGPPNAKMCSMPSCTDKVKNGNETAPDCGGGTCPVCPDASTCKVPADCASHVCSGAPLLCQAATCFDLIKNGSESDTDCGGSCSACANTKTCAAGSDCASGKCGPSSTCVPWTLTFGSSTLIGPYTSSLAIDRKGEIAWVIFMTSPPAGTKATFLGNDYTLGNGWYFPMAKLAADGTPIFSRMLGDGNAMDVRVTFDANGNVIVLASPYSFSNFGGELLPAIGASDIVVALYDGNTGSYMRGKRFGGTGIDSATGITVTSGGDIVVAGTCSAGVDFGGGVLPNKGKTDICVARLRASDLSHVWSVSFGGADDDSAATVDVDAQDNVLVAGSFRSPSLQLGAKTYTNAGRDDFVVLKLAGASGNLSWSKVVGTSGIDFGQIVGAGSDALVVGAIDDGAGATLSIDGFPLTATYFDQAFGTRLAGDTGKATWLKQFAGILGPHGACTDRGGNFVMTFESNYTAGFGGPAVTPLGPSDILVGKISAQTGEQQAIALWGSSGDDRGGALACSKASSNVVVGGFFQGTVDFPGGSKTSAGTTNAFVSSLGGL